MLFETGLNAGDWPQYRGPGHDGRSTDNIRLNWAEEPPRQLWRVSLEPGLSSFSISGGKAFTQVRRPTDNGEQEFCIALNADTGEELWATPLGIADYPHGGVGWDDGPRSTPSVDGDRVFVLTSYLRMVCLDAANGREIWSKDFVAENGARVIEWQNAASPLLVGDLVFLNANVSNQRLMALKKQDGSVAWKKHDDVMTQATPIAATMAGVAQIIFFAQSGLVSVVPETGDLLWRFPFWQSTSTAASPVVGDDIVYCSAAYGRGAAAARVKKAGAGVAADEVWRTPGANMNHWATPVHHEGYLYGMYGHGLISLRCVDLATGKDTWRQGGVGYGSTLFVNGHVLMLTEDGYLVLVKPDPAQYSEVARYRALDGSKSSIKGLPVKCWNVPAISDGRIYVRSTTEAAAYDVAAKPLPKLKFAPAIVFDNDGLQLSIANEDGSPADTNRVASIEVLATFDLAAGPAGWIKLDSVTVSPDGKVRFDDPQGVAAPQRYFRVQERR